MLPVEFTSRMERMLGNEYKAFERAFDSKKYQALRINGLKINGDGCSASQWFLEKMDNEGAAESGGLPFHLRPVPWAEDGFYYEEQDTPGKHPYHEAGVYYIQEPSAMAPVPYLQTQPGDKVLDLCAAPGGKSTQIASALQGKGLLIANEIHPARAKILSENIERMSVRDACVTNETPQHLAEYFPEYFDKILVDAPCSGEGMFRKNEVACEEWSQENVRICGERQDEILDRAAEMLRPGGRMVYSTCTFAPMENEGSVARFLTRHPEFSLEIMDKSPFMKQAEAIAGGLGDRSAEDTEICADALNGRSEYLAFTGQPEDALLQESMRNELSKTLRIWPHLVQGEGHFAAVLVKAGQVPEGYVSRGRLGPEKGISEKELGEYPAFARETLQSKPEGKYLKFGDNIYLVPEELPCLKGLKVLRPGLHLGTLKKNRFEPSHALALALSPKEAVHIYNLSSEESTCAAYLNGQTFPAEGEKGWYLITVDGFSLGWGKLAGGMMKNHYPKGLRINY